MPACGWPDGEDGVAPPPAHMAPCPQVGRCGRGVRPGVQTGATLSRQMGGCGRTRVVSVVCTSLCIQLLTPHTQDKTQMCGDSHASGSLRARQQQQQLQPNKDQTRCRHGDMPTSWARVTELAGGSVPKIDTARATVFMLVVLLVVDRVRRRRADFLFFLRLRTLICSSPAPHAPAAFGSCHPPRRYPVRSPCSQALAAPTAPGG